MCDKRVRLPRYIQNSAVRVDFYGVLMFGTCSGVMVSK